MSPTTNRIIVITQRRVDLEGEAHSAAGQQASAGRGRD